MARMVTIVQDAGILFSEGYILHSANNTSASYYMPQFPSSILINGRMTSEDNAVLELVHMIEYC